MSWFLRKNIIQKNVDDKAKCHEKKTIVKLLGTLNDKSLSVVDPQKVVKLTFKLNKLFGDVMSAYDANQDYVNKRYGIGSKEYAKIKGLITGRYASFNQIKEGLGGERAYHLVFNDNIPSAIQIGGFNISEPGASSMTKTLDIVQLILDVAGFAPGIGIIPDVVSLILSSFRGNFYEALCSLINVIPIIGSFVGTPMKYIRRYRKLKNKLDLKNNIAQSDYDNHYYSARPINVWQGQGR